jgi:ankyrin repeat protein
MESINKLELFLKDKNIVSAKALIKTMSNEDIKSNSYAELVFKYCSDEHIEILNILITDERFDLNQELDNYGTIFSFACSGGHSKVVEKFINNERVDVNKMAPLNYACLNNHIEVVKILINNPRVEVNAEHQGMMTPFILACIMGNADMVDLFLKNDRVDVTPREKLVPFNEVCRAGYIELVKMLMQDKRIDKNIKIDGKSALEMAQEKGHSEIVELLQEAQAKQEGENEHNVSLSFDNQIADDSSLYEVKIEEGESNTPALLGGIVNYFCGVS